MQQGAKPTTVCQFCGTKLMEMADYCYKCERKLDYPEVSEECITNVKELGKCSACGRPINIQNQMLICKGCNKEFCGGCEEEFRDYRERGEKPFCPNCFPQYQELIRKLSMGVQVPK